jgi:UDP-N-acetylglucosamine pyrophosphorylase
MEVTRRTASDRKGGHLCTDRSTGRLVLRESAQCPEADSGAFQDIDRHRYFNTNNLWVDLAALRRALDERDGILPLPVIHNRKTVDPRDPASTPVLQLETAMGAAIGCFDGATALEVPRSRFAPVKSTSDLLALRSDAYELTPGFLVVLAASRQGVPPEIELDPAHYKLVDGLDALAGGSLPSLIRCRRLAVCGPWRFTGPSSVAGDVTFSNPGAETADIAPRDYADEVVLAGP